MLASVGETASGAAVFSKTADMLASLAEAASGAGVFDGGRLYVVDIAETASGAAAFTKNAVFVGTRAEVASSVAAFTAIRTVNASPSGVQLYVDLGNVLIWVVIDDTQNPGWTTLPS
jgi:hypothetical protein